MYGCITVDPDLNITVELSLDSAFAAGFPLQHHPSPSNARPRSIAKRVTVIEYGDNTTVKKTEAA